ncbi:MAG: imelysin family protein [Hyphomicrobiaceae bacterium]
MSAPSQRVTQFICCAVIWALCLPYPASSAVLDQAQRVARVLEKLVIPGFERLDASAEKLPPAVRAWCAAGGNTASKEQRSKAYASLVAAFGDTAEAWGGVEFFRFGPLATKGRRERFSFWPDPRGVMARQLRQILAAKDAALLEPGALAKQSAAVQGLPALEYLIVQPGSQTAQASSEEDYSCQLAGAVADNLAALAHEINDEWTKVGGYRQMMLDTGPDHKFYKSDTEAASELVRSLLTGLQVVAETQVAPRAPTGTAPKPRKRAKVEKPTGPFSRINAESRFFVGQTHALKALYDGLDLESNLAPNRQWMKGWASGAWNAILRSDGLGGPAKGTPADAAPSPQQVAGRINGLRQLIGREMANASGIPIGFNELDGD